MALTLTPLEVLNKVVEDRVPSLRLTSYPLLQAMNNAGRMKTKSDTNILWDVEVGGGSAAIEPVTADGADTATDSTIPAQLRIGRYRIKHQFSVSTIEIAEAATRAPQDIADIFNAQVDRGLTHILRMVNQLLYTGDGTGASAEIVGLSKIIDPSYVYAGINPVMYPLWKALSINNAGTNRPLTKNLMLSFEEACKIAEYYHDMIVVHPSTGTKYNQLFDTIAGSLVVNTGDASAQGLPRVEVGNGYRTYMGMPILEDVMCQPGKMFFLSSSDIDFFTFNVATNKPGVRLAPDAPVASSRVAGMNVHVAELPSQNSANRRFELYVLPQMRLWNRKQVQVIEDIG